MTTSRSTRKAGYLGFHPSVLCALLLVAVAITASAFTQFAAAQTFNVLHTFTRGADASNPVGGLTLDPEGNLYGTSSTGGAFNYGAVFKVEKTGQETVVDSFDFNDGWYPSSSLFRDSEGRFYGTADGGEGGKCQGCGTVFSLDPGGKLKRLITFSGGTDGWYPIFGVTRDPLGNLYGTTFYGGVPNACGGLGCGVLFRLDTAGKETVLHTFQGGPSVGDLLRDEEGNLYGTSGGGECGIVFKVDPNGHESVLYAFTGQADGCGPIGLVRDDAGNFYGATGGGGDFSNCGEGCGTVFKLDPQGKHTVLYTFRGDTDGAIPDAGVIRDASGNLYGPTSNNGNSYGVVFKVDPSGKETVLHAFSGGADGAQPMGKLALDPSGNLYGVTENGGDPTCKCGVVFEISAAP